MAGTIYSGTYFNGIVLSNPATQLPATIAASGYVTNTGTLDNGDAVYGAPGTAWTLDNLGTIRGGAMGSAIQLESGGYVTNAGSINSSAGGIEIDNAAGTVVNSGSIRGATGVSLQTSGTITNTGVISGSLGIEAGTGPATIVNQAAGTITGTSTAAVFDPNGGPVTVINSGAIANTGTNGEGIRLEGGGSVANTGSITASSAGVDFEGAVGTVTNSGVIAGGAGVYLEVGGTITNTGTITATLPGGRAITAGRITARPATIANLGTVSTSAGTGIALGPGTVVNGSAAAPDARITGYNGVSVYYGAGTVTNFGTILAVGGAGGAVNLYAGGSITNQSGALLQGGGVAVAVSGAAGTVTNIGTINGTSGFGLVGTGVSFGTLTGGSTLINAGTIIGQSGSVYSYISHTFVTQPGTAVAFYGGSNQLILDPGASFTGIVNGGTANDTLELAAGTGTGTLSGFGTSFTGFETLTIVAGASWQLAAGNTIPSGIVLTDSGTLANAGNIAATATLFPAGTLSNSGAITGAVALSTGATLTNQASGTISGTGDAVTGSGGAATLTNAGTIIGAGGTAVAFAGGGNRLIVDPGAVFSGIVNGGTANDTLELAAGTNTGTLSGLGTSFTGFTTVAVDPAAVWQISDAPAAPAIFINDGTIIVGPGGLVFGAVSEDSGQSGVIELSGSSTAEFTGAVASAQTVIFSSAPGEEAKLDAPSGFAGAVANFQAGNTLDLAGAAANGYTYSGGVLTLTENGTAVAALRVATPYTSPAFTLAADGNGGTLVTDRGALAGSVVLSAASERVALPADTAVARFSDGNPADTASGFTATIAWGDGVISAGTITGGDGAFTVSGGHTFADEGSFPLAVTIVRTADNTPLDLAGTLTAGENDSLSPASAGLTVIAGRTFSGTVATFADADTTAPAADFTATIAWGDGTTSAGTVSGGNGVFTVSGSHPYTTAGNRPLIVTLADDLPGTATATATGTAAVVPGNIFSGFYPNGIVLNNPAIESPPTITSTAYVTNTPGHDSVTAAAGFAWTLATYGRIAGPGDGVVFAAPGAVNNSGTITGANGIVLTAGGTITSKGTVTGSTGAGVYLGNGGALLNGAGALMTGRYGVEIGGGAGSGVVAINQATIYGTNIGFAAGDAIGDTLTNAGTVGGGGGIAIQFGDGSNLLVADPGAAFHGRVNGGAGYNALELAAGSGAGALLGLGAKFHNFAAVAVDPGAVWHLAGTPTSPPAVANDGRIIVGGGHSLTLGPVGGDSGMSGVIAVRASGTLTLAGGVDPTQTVHFADRTGTLVLDDPQDFGATIRGFRSGDVIDFANATADGFTYSGGVLTLTSGGNPTASVALSGTLGASQFALKPDGQGGTDVTAAAGQLFAFTFIYADGDAYYSGTVADDGSLGYAKLVASGTPTISEPDGTYTLASAGPATTEPSGAVTVASYTASPPEANAAQSYVPLATSQGQFDGHAGLGSEADSIRVNGTLFAFSPSLEYHPLLAS